MARFIRYVRRSLAGPLLFVALGFIAVPIAIYLTFQQADQDRQALLIRTVHAQGRIVANSVAPILSGGDRSTFDEAGADLAGFSIAKARVRLLFRPAKLTGITGFYLVASAPRIEADYLGETRQELIRQGVLDDLSLSCNVPHSPARRYREGPANVEYIASIAPVVTPAGCWAIVFSYPTAELLGADSAQPYWRRLELHRAALIYLGLAFVTLLVFVTIRRNVLEFGRRARRLRLGSDREENFFVEQNELAELHGVAEELDRMVATLSQSAESIRRRAEDNVDAFKTPIAVMRQSLEPFRRDFGSDEVRGRRALEVMSQAVERLDKLIDDARRADEAAAELLDPPRRPIDLSRLLRRVARGYSDAAERRSIVFVSSLPEGLVVLGSEGLIETAVEAVLDNAVSFCPPGGRVELHLHRRGSRAVIAIANNGPAIPSQYSHQIFERGFSLRAPGAANYEGKPHGGIGLWATRRNLQALGGTIIAVNVPGEGVLMILDLPLAGTPPTARQLRRLWILGAPRIRDQARL
ncbi:MAG TPA: HAMP domain-containing sensor histidine kinase [Dongiaceae bacterium]|jgi:two-component system sensor histidine kinase ChvG